MNETDWAIEYARRLTTRGETYAPEDIATTLLTLVAQITQLHMDCKHLRIMADEREGLKAENERLRAASDAWCAAEKKL
jgi:hypothetical protein